MPGVVEASLALCRSLSSPSRRKDAASGAAGRAKTAPRRASSVRKNRGEGIGREAGADLESGRSGSDGRAGWSGDCLVGDSAELRLARRNSNEGKGAPVALASDGEAMKPKWVRRGGRSPRSGGRESLACGAMPAGRRGASRAVPREAAAPSRMLLSLSSSSGAR